MSFNQVKEKEEEEDRRGGVVRFPLPMMDGVIGLVNRIKHACSLIEDQGYENAVPTLCDSLPTIVVVGGQSSGKSSVLESIVGRDFLPRGSGIVTRRPLVLQLYKLNDGGEDYAQFLHLGNKNFTDFSLVRKEIQQETDREIGKGRQISSLTITLSIYSSNAVNLTLVDLPGLTNVAIAGQPESIVQDIADMVRSYVVKPNSLILAITPANQDIATSDAIKLVREVDPTGERTIGVLTKLDLMDKGTNALEVLEGRSYRLKQPWVGVVNRSQADINGNVDMLAARRKECEFFATSPDYGHLASRMGSKYLAKLLSKYLESIIETRIPNVKKFINLSIDELEKELYHLGKPVASDSNAQLYFILELCRTFERTFKEHLDGGRSGGDSIYRIFTHQLPTALEKLPFDRHLSLQNIKRVISEADGYQPHLISPEQGYRRLIEVGLNYFHGPAEASVNAVDYILREIMRKSIYETEELRRFPNLKVEIATAATEALDKFRAESKKTVLRMVDMESSYLTVDFFRKLSNEAEAADHLTKDHFKRIGSNVSSYISLVSNTLKNTIPKALVLCQIREAKNSLLVHLYTRVGRKEDHQLARLLDEDPDLMEKRRQCERKLHLYKEAWNEIDSAVSFQ
ncbi:phragmoplastin DRP1E-like [Impatiens glandulifera]|uniref:phragmoplastin DRP1E-like n=1 Tax=Impatiens glandulifera TaxID=253017 RepID=UPI001FB0635E|nr:phragmoplastin DRP1E-like [Impatiens glandulifera]